MLRDPVEIEIASRARQEGIRNPNRPRKHFDRIFKDFLRDDALVRDRELLDLGPGQWDFAEVARERGVRRVVGVDNDEAVLELGTYKGFDAVDGDLRDVSAETLGTFDGVFCKFSIDAFWGVDDAETELQTARVCGLVREGGWAWIAPWNGAAQPLDPADARLAAQQRVFEEHGFRSFALSAELVTRYGLTGVVANHALFVHNLPIPGTVAACPAL